MTHFAKLQQVDIREKSRYERVTTVDRTIHRFLKHELPKIFPAPVLSEENSTHWKPCSSYWVVDPIDGTTNYITRIPFFCVGVGLVINNSIVLNAVYNPILRELFSAEKNKGAFLNGKKLRPDHKLPLSKSIIGVSYSHSQQSIQRAGRIGLRLRKTVHNTRHSGSTLLTFAYVAAGRLEGSIVMGPITPWDSIPALLLIEEIHGCITDFSGKPYKLGHTQNIIATNGANHVRLQKIVSSTR
jgi:myo-inositol-1(or 4)-monophosphatase